MASEAKKINICYWNVLIFFDLILNWYKEKAKFGWKFYEVLNKFY